MNYQANMCDEPLHLGDTKLGHIRRRSASFWWTALLWFVVLGLPSTSAAQSALTDDADSQSGHAPSLTLSISSNVYLKFNPASTLPTGTSGSSVTKATIKLYLGSVKTPGTVDVYQLISDWSEQTIASTSPILGNQLQAGIPIQSDQEGKFLVIEITAAVQQWLGTDGLGTGGAPNHGVALVARDGASLTIDSKENSQTSHEPQLNIQLERAAGSLTSVTADAPLSVTNPTTAPHITLGVVPADKGGTGLSSSGAAGNFLRSEGSSWTSGPLLAPDIPPGSEHYIQNSSNPQSATNFNIGGTGSADTLNAATQFNLGGNRVLSQPGTNNLFAGFSAGAANTGQNNSFFGNSAGLANLSGNFNSFFGSAAGRLNSIGSNNSFFGSNAGLANTSGFQNSFFGREAGANNTTGSFNSFYGRSAGLFNTTGSGNTLFGQDAGVLNTTGGANAFFGTAAGQANQTGNNNSFFGVFAGDTNTTGSNNTVIGAGADVAANNLNNATAIGSGAVVSTNNTIVLGRGVDAVQVPGALNVNGTLGANVLNAATQFNLGGSRVLSNAGTNNFFAGVDAGVNNTTGSNNNFFGTKAGANNTSGGANSFFGHQAGISNTSGGFNSFFGHNAGAFSTTGSGNSFFGNVAGLSTTTGISNAFFGANAGQGNTTGNLNTFVGGNTGFDEPEATGDLNSSFGNNARVSSGVSNSTAIGASAKVEQSNSLVLGSINGVNGAVANTNVGIGTPAPKAKLEVTGGNILVGSPGQGIILKSPNSATCRLLSIDNAGGLTLVAVACP